ncbi:MAG: hypothetical protein ACYDCQ_07280 [Dehalococcoidia bacterium]
MSLVSRHLEANGIPTVMMGCARDIVEQCGVPRFVFSDFPLGNPCGRPSDKPMQRSIVRLALDVLESSVAPRTTVQTPFIWSADPTWKQRFLNAEQVRPPAEAVAGAAGDGD